MKISNKYRHEYVCCTTKTLSNKIMKAVVKEISTLALTDDEKQKAIENAEFSKVCDLTDTIKIEFVA